MITAIIIIHVEKEVCSVFTSCVLVRFANSSVTVLQTGRIQLITGSTNWIQPDLEMSDPAGS